MKPFCLLKVFAAAMVVCCLSTGMQSCHKKKNAAADTTSTSAAYDFSVSGNLLTGSIVSFQSTAPDTSTFLWNFGDGITSAAANPTHIYSRTDSFAVTLIVHKNTAHAVSKFIYISPAPDSGLVVGMAGMKYWHGYLINDFQSATGRDTISTINDQFIISVLNSTTIIAKNDTMGCYYTDPVNHVYYFDHIVNRYSWAEVAYYFTTNSFFYTYQPDNGGDPKYGPYSSATVLYSHN